jgi:hypothetical protein
MTQNSVEISSTIYNSQSTSPKDVNKKVPFKEVSKRASTCTNAVDVNSGEEGDSRIRQLLQVVWRGFIQEEVV